jgi:hypothetical protein
MASAKACDYTCFYSIQYFMIQFRPAHAGGGSRNLRCGRRRTVHRPRSSRQCQRRTAPPPRPRWPQRRPAPSDQARLGRRLHTATQPRSGGSGGQHRGATQHCAARRGPRSVLLQSHRTYNRTANIVVLGNNGRLLLRAESRERGRGGGPGWAWTMQGHQSQLSSRTTSLCDAL